MSQRVLWLSNPDGDEVDYYEVWRSPDNVIPYVLIATVIANKADILVYLPVTQQFFYDDAGLVTDYYKVRAHSASGFSGYTQPKQPETAVPPLCRIYGKVLDLNGVPQNDVLVKVTILSTEKDQSGQFIGNKGINSLVIDVITDADGDWEQNLMQGGVVEIKIPSMNLTKIVTIPAADNADLSSLM